MTAQVSTNPAKPINNFGTNYFNKVKSYLKLMVVLLVLHLVSAPLNLINIIVFSGKLEKYKEAILLNPDSSSYPYFNYLYPVIGILATGLAVLCGVIIALGIYNYFYKKSNVDMVYALPLTTNQRFFSDFLAGVTVYLLPYVISCVISMIIHGVGCMVQPAYNEQIARNITGTTDGITITSLLIYVMIAGFLIMLMTYTLTVLVMTCCGSLFESIAYNILVNILIPGTIAVFFFFMIGDLYGVNYLQSIIEVIIRTSPIGAVIGLYAWAFGDLSPSYYGWDSVYSSFWSIYIPIFLITMGMLALAWYLNKKRKPEQVSKPFIFKIFYYIMISCVTFCMGCLFTMDDDKNANIIPLIIVSAIVYFIFELITNRGFKKFYMSVIRYAVTITAVLGLIWISGATEGFGAVRKIPTADSVKSVTVTGLSPFMYQSHYDYDYILTDKESIEAVVGVHQDVLNRYDPESYARHQYDTVGEQDFNITYRLKSGISFSRQYSITDEEMLSLRNIERTEEYRSQMFDNLGEKFESYPYITINDFNFLSGGEFLTDNDHVIANEFLAALEADLVSFSDEEYFEPSGEYLFPIYVGLATEFAITENHKNVLNFCMKYHPQFKSLLNYKSKMISNLAEMELHAPESIVSDVDGEKLYASYGGRRSGNFMDYFEFGNYNKEDIEKIFEVAQPYYITDEECYSIWIDNPRGSYIIPKEYSHLIESYYNRYNVEWEKFTEKYPYCEDGGQFFTDDMDRGYLSYNSIEGYNWTTKMIFNMNKVDHILLYATGGQEFSEGAIPFEGTLEFPDGTIHSYSTLSEYYMFAEEHGFVPAKRVLENTVVGDAETIKAASVSKVVVDASAYN